ncbi:hypothetical protein EBR78_10600 [bacterium]|nr:hypothetical protein [bacterium]
MTIQIIKNDYHMGVRCVLVSDGVDAVELVLSGCGVNVCVKNNSNRKAWHRGVGGGKFFHRSGEFTRKDVIESYKKKTIKEMIGFAFDLASVS